MKMIAQKSSKHRMTLRRTAECFLVLISIIVLSNFGTSKALAQQAPTIDPNATVSPTASSSPSPSATPPVTPSVTPELTPTPTPTPVTRSRGELKLKLPDNMWTFPEVVVQTTPQVVAIPMARNNKKIEVRETRSNLPGWSLTVTGSHLVDGLETISVRNMGVIPRSFEAVVGSRDGVSLGPQAAFMNMDDPLLIIQANKGTGLGQYDVDCDLHLTIPANLVSGDYQGEVVFTLQ